MLSFSLVIKLPNGGCVAHLRNIAKMKGNIMNRPVLGREVFSDENATMHDKAIVLQKGFNSFRDIDDVCEWADISRATVLRIRMYIKLDPAIRTFIDDLHLSYNHVSAINRAKNNRYALQALLAEIKKCGLTGKEALAFSDLVMVRHGHGDTTWVILRRYSKGKIVPLPYLSELSYEASLRLRDRLFEILSDVEALSDATDEIISRREKALEEPENGTGEETEEDGLFI